MPLKSYVSNIPSEEIGPGCTPNPTIESPIRYRGWNIFYWTGWKGFRAVMNLVGEPDRRCCICRDPIRDQEALYVTMDMHEDEMCHFNCASNPNKYTLAGQWIAVPKDVGRDETGLFKIKNLAYSSYPGTAGLTVRGGIFDIKIRPDQIRPTIFSTREFLDKAREAALVALKRFIDSLEGGEA